MPGRPMRGVERVGASGHMLDEKTPPAAKGFAGAVWLGCV